MRKWIPLVAICLGTFMLLVDVSMAAPPMPCTAREAISTPAFGAMPQVSEATAKTTRPIR